AGRAVGARPRVRGRPPPAGPVPRGPDRRRTAAGGGRGPSPSRRPSVTQVNLLPREVRQRQRVRRQSLLVGFVGALVVGVLVLFWFLQGVRLNDLDNQVKAQEAVNNGLQQQVNGLQKYATLKNDLLQRKQLLTSALANRVEWSGVLHHMSQIEPNRMWLTTMTGTAP